MSLRTQLLRSADDLASIWPEFALLRTACDLDNDVLLDPAHFLAVSSEDRVPAVVVCREGERLVGVVFATEQAKLGARTGYVVGGDFIGRGLLVCQPSDEIALLEAAVKCLGRHSVHSVHLRYQPRVEESLTCRGFEVKTLQAEVPGDTLRLGPTFEQFLQRLGKHTRRNIRYYSRKAAEAGITFEICLSDEEFIAERKRMNGESKFAADQAHMDRDDRIMGLYGGGSRMCLRGPDGRLVALMCGFVWSGRFHLLTQWNDAAYEKLSLSSVLRASAIEYLIQCGHTEALFMGGSSLNLGRFCQPEFYRSVLVDRRLSVTAVMKLGLAYFCRRRAAMGKPLSLRVEQLCGGFLDNSRLIKRTALSLAAVGFGMADEAMTV